MDDTDLIARVYPCEDKAYRYAQTAIEKTCSRYMPPMVALQETSRIQRSRGARDSTETPERDEDDDPDKLPYLELRFSDVPRNSSGLVFGTDHTCDIVLPKIPGISKRHFALTYKNKFADGLPRLIVRDLGSKFGTSVTYDGQGKERRSRFDWIMDGFKATKDTEQFIVQVHENLKFRILVARHDIASHVYIENVEPFRHGAAAAEELLRGLGLQSGPETEPNTGAHTPVENPILLRRGQIAKGGFGVVSHHWNVSTGEEYARKKPADKRYDRTTWEKEIDIMDRISHEHIVRLCFFEKEPRPVLYLEYMPLGNLEDEHNRVHFSPEECLTILHQSLLALVHLHGLPQPVVHRDIKPENILVKHRDPDRNPEYLHVKLSDFGLSKSGSLKTFCGSKTYCPPEIRDSGTPYTKAVDIWSLGVVILRFAYGLPRPGGGIGMRWCRKIVQVANDWDSDGLIDILQRMLVIDAQTRYSAPACLQESSRLRLSSGDRSPTPTPASYAAGYGATMAHVSSEGLGGGGEQETLRILPPEQYLSQYNDQASSYSLPAHADGRSDLLVENPDDSYEARRNVRSNGPPPDSMERTGATTGKRTKRESKSASSSSGRRTKRRTFTSGHHPETFRTVLQDLDRFNDAAEAQDWLPDEDNLDCDPEELTEFVDPHYISEWSVSASQQSSALVDAGPDVTGDSDDTTVVQQAQAAFGVPAECFQDDPRQGAENLSHLSTRSVRHGDGETLYIVINRQRVSMRMSDCFLNATAICAAASLSKNARDAYMKKIKSRGALSKGNRCSWVSFRDGVFLSKAVNLFDDMKALLSHAPISLPEGENYLLEELQFRVLEYGGISIAYLPSDRVVNAAHLLKLGNRGYHDLEKFLRMHREIRREVRRCGKRHIQGTYISFEDAERLCQFLGLQGDPVRQLRTACTGEPNNVEDDGEGEVDEDQEAAFEGFLHPSEANFSLDDGKVCSLVANDDSSSPSTPRQTGSERHQSASSGNVDCESDMEYDGCWMDPLHKLGGGILAVWAAKR